MHSTESVTQPLPPPHYKYVGVDLVIDHAILESLVSIVAINVICKQTVSYYVTIKLHFTTHTDKVSDIA